MSFVDSNIFIYVMMSDPSYSERALKVLTGLEEGKGNAWTSTLALSQVFSHLKKRKKHKAIEQFYDYIDGAPIRVTETTREDLNNARIVRVEQNLPWDMWDDLVLVSQMQRLDISEIYSSDKDFDRIRGLKRLF